MFSALILVCGVFWTNMLQPLDGKSLPSGVPLGSELSVRKLGLLSSKGDVPSGSG